MIVMNNVRVQWISEHKTAKQRSDPRYPDGIDIDLSRASEGEECCIVELPYPAPEVGRWLLTCPVCDKTMVITAAGRRDDPRTILVACSQRKQLGG